MLLSTIFIISIASSIQSIIADDSDLLGVNIILTKDSELEVHLQVVVRDSQGQLVSVTESTSGFTTVALSGKMITGIVMVDDKQVVTNLTDNVFNKEVEKEIIAVDDIKYEKVQYVDSPMKEDEVDYVSIWALMVCGEIYGHGHKCVSVFQAGTAVGLVTQTDVVPNQWTILRDLD